MELAQLAPQQWAGVGLAVAAIGMLWKDQLATLIAGLWPTPTPAPQPEPADDDMADLLAVKRIQRRADRNQSPQLQAAAQNCLRFFFATESDHDESQ